MTKDDIKTERIAKRLARAGLCSRREAEAWIRAGRVAVDGEVLDSPAVNVGAGSHITVDGKPVPQAEPTRLWRYHKPPGLLTTTRDPQRRPTVFDALPKDMPRVVTIGRLDLNSEGLLLLTNDGGLARRLELPATGWLRRYRVRVRGIVDQARLEALDAGIEIDGIRYGPIRARLDRQLTTNAWLTMALAEGKNREVRRVCEHLGWPVLRLIRLSYGPFQLGGLKRGEVAEVPARVLRDQLGADTGPAGPQKPDKRPPSRPSPARPGRARMPAGAKQKSAAPSAGKKAGAGADTTFGRPRRRGHSDAADAQKTTRSGHADRRRKT